MVAFSLVVKRAVLAIVLPALALRLFEKYSNDLPLHIAGQAEARFERVKAVFEQNFVDGWEREGASLTVYHHGKKVVDLWGGYADRASLRKWKEDTIQVVFSSTKGVGAVCVAMLVDRGYVSYDDLVTKNWPEFGQNGKDNVTVQMLVSHASGLSYFDENLTVDDAMDHMKISSLIEKQTPHWPPGTRSGYHMLTHGWLLDQLIRRVDPKHRSIGQFVKEELHDAHGVDFHIGLPDDEMGRVARLTLPNVIDRTREIIDDLHLVKLLVIVKNLLTDSMMSRSIGNLPWLEAITRLTVNDPDLWKIEQTSALGIGNARSLAQIYSLLQEKKLVSQKTLDLLQVLHYNDQDLLLGFVLAKGNGMIFSPLERGKAAYAIGHAGHGCQQAMVDFGNGLAIGYTTNALKTGFGDLCGTWSRLHTAIYDSLEF